MGTRARGHPLASSRVLYGNKGERGGNGDSGGKWRREESFSVGMAVFSILSTQYHDGQRAEAMKEGWGEKS